MRTVVKSPSGEDSCDCPSGEDRCEGVIIPSGEDSCEGVLVLRTVVKSVLVVRTVAERSYCEDSVKIRYL